MREGSTFVDTNILLYCFDSQNLEKRLCAHESVNALWASSTGRLSWQVLNEFYVNAISKAKMQEEQARDVVRLYRTWRPVALNYRIVERSWHWRDSAQTSYWDSLILAAAEQLGCRWLLSEDFQHGRRYGDVTVLNPFLDSAGTL